MTSLGCARCGDCCDPVGLSGHVQDLIEQWRVYLAVNPDEVVEGLDPSYRFAIDHWKAYEGPSKADNDTGHRDFMCDKFNPQTRLCEAYEDRPPVCDKFPHNGDNGEIDPSQLYVRCSYNLDVPPSERSAGARPLIPVTVIHH